MPHFSSLTAEEQGLSVHLFTARLPYSESSALGLWGSLPKFSPAPNF